MVIFRLMNTVTIPSGPAIEKNILQRELSRISFLLSLNPEEDLKLPIFPAGSRPGDPWQDAETVRYILRNLEMNPRIRCFISPIKDEPEMKRDWPQAMEVFAIQIVS
jgi:hypothetical protein